MDADPFSDAFPALVIAVRCVPADLALATQIAAALSRQGVPCECSVVPGRLRMLLVKGRRWITRRAAPLPADERRPQLVLWTPRSAGSLVLQRFAQGAAARGLLRELSVGGAGPAGGFVGAAPLRLDGGAVDRPAMVRLAEALGAPAADPFSMFGGDERTWIKPAGPAAAPLPDIAWDLDTASPFRDLTPALEPVLLAASAPRRAEPGGSFTAGLAVYIDAARDAALRRLAAFGEDGDRVVSDIAPDQRAGWRVGAPVCVRLLGAGLLVAPGERRFEWSGRENVAAFAVTVPADAAPGSVELCFQVSVAEVPMAFIPLRVTVGAAPAADAPPSEQRVPRSAFASYASKDAADVTRSLSTLQRWAPGLDIFLDCLDLVPGEQFKPRLAEQIARRDAFLLFWSRRAAASPWVRWEIDTACERKGIAAILPMPLEDPAIAPPPPELADAQWRDRFMLAGYGLAKIGEIAASPP